MMSNPFRSEPDGDDEPYEFSEAYAVSPYLKH
jgi:hypothetical protein